MSRCNEIRNRFARSVSLKIRLQVGRACFVGASFLTAACLPLGSSPNAQPQHSDPILRYPALEEHRISPNPDPSLVVPREPGRQAVVLREYQSDPPGNDTLPPVLLQIPDEYFLTKTSKPREVWGINLLLQYPTM